MLGCREKASPRIDLRTYPHAAGYELRLSSSYTAQERNLGWRVTPSQAAGNTREPIEIAVDIVTGPTSGGGSLERVGQRQLRREMETSEGGSSGDAVTLRYVEELGPQYIRYQQVRYADGATPRFELDVLIRQGGLSVVKDQAARGP